MCTRIFFYLYFLNNQHQSYTISNKHFQRTSTYRLPSRDINIRVFFYLNEAIWTYIFQRFVFETPPFSSKVHTVVDAEAYSTVGSKVSVSRCNKKETEPWGAIGAVRAFFLFCKVKMAGTLWSVCSSVIPTINSLDYELVRAGVGECWREVSPATTGKPLSGNTGRVHFVFL